MRESNVENIDSEICIKIDEDLVEQMKNADMNGITNVKLHVPKYNTIDNWPQATYLGERISNTLYKHRIVKNKLNVETIPDLSYNEKYKELENGIHVVNKMNE